MENIDFNKYTYIDDIVLVRYAKATEIAEVYDGNGEWRKLSSYDLSSADDWESNAVIINDGDYDYVKMMIRNMDNK